MISLKIGEKTFSIIRLNEISSEEENVNAKRLIGDYSCPRNEEVEFFLKNNAFDFSERKQAITYLIFLENIFVAYFTLANKLIQVKKEKISKSVLKRLLRIAEDTGEEMITVPAILVAQLGKNYFQERNKMLSGENLLSIIHYFITEVQNLIGGVVYFLECDSDRQKVIDFYERNSFVQFAERKSTSNKIKLLQFMKKI